MTDGNTDKVYIEFDILEIHQIKIFLSFFTCAEIENMFDKTTVETIKTFYYLLCKNTGGEQ
jgi:hypothetical protein